MSDYLFTRDIPDGRRLFVMPLTYGRARLAIGPADSPCHDDAY